MLDQSSDEYLQTEMPLQSLRPPLALLSRKFLHPYYIRIIMSAIARISYLVLVWSTMLPHVAYQMARFRRSSGFVSMKSIKEVLHLKAFIE
jgi:hypothetical protein